MGWIGMPQSWTKELYMVIPDGRRVNITDIPTVETLDNEPKMSAGVIIEDGDETRIYERLEED